MDCVKDKVVHILDPAPCYEDIFTAREKAPIIHCTGDWVAPTATQTQWGTENLDTPLAH